MLVTWQSYALQVAATLRAALPAPFPSLATLVVAPPTAMLVTWQSSAHQVAATLRAALPAPFPSLATRFRRRRRPRWSRRRWWRTWLTLRAPALTVAWVVSQVPIKRILADALFLLV